MALPEREAVSKDYYAVLGVLDSAENVVIKGAYRALAQRYHPDRFEGGAEVANQLMSNINEAYLVLSNPALRQAYDELRRHLPEQQESECVVAIDQHHGFEVEQYRPFAMRLAEWGYDFQAIKDALIARGVRVQIAQLLAQQVRQYPATR